MSYYICLYNKKTNEAIECVRKSASGELGTWGELGTLIDFLRYHKDESGYYVTGTTDELSDELSRRSGDEMDFVSSIDEYNEMKEHHDFYVEMGGKPIAVILWDGSNKDELMARKTSDVVDDIGLFDGVPNKILSVWSELLPIGEKIK